ncbi:SigE family RNA polymerase sigma factor [Catellatospora sp. KI3]|uniref:SigE family RNA polymerase sigma factor n=1 Tax=Catellatospora sp. KI3 TaxID=3041620 RepID=UPI0024826B87|nr:SigE family RNA polymerase sigma factor [Catellatospora sp. KI3]MDI1466324.1 SigE family RNA polymerase sigma factor [Catellatospora sp. KI3]
MGDDYSFEAYVRARLPALTRTAFLLTGGDAHDAEDLVQAALARVVVRWKSLDDPDAYVRRALHHQSVSRWRRLRARPPELLTASPPEHGASSDPDTRLVVAAALHRLTPRQRAVLVLRFYEDRTEAQAAEIMGVGIGTALSADGDRVALASGSGETAVYQRDRTLPDLDGVGDATLLWRAALPRSQVSGSGAFTPEGRLAVVTYAEEQCWSLLGHGPVSAETRRRCAARVELLDAATGEPVPGSFPVVPEALGMEVVGWHGGSAYAVRPGLYGRERADLIRLDPGAAEPVVVLDTPPGTSSLAVATAYLGSSRAAGAADTGFDWSAAGWHALWWLVVVGVPLIVLSTPVVLVVALVRRLRRRRARRRAHRDHLALLDAAGA